MLKWLGNPRVLRRANGWAAVFWVIVIPVAAVAGWLQSVTFVSALSIYALVASHLSAWQSARVEVVQADDANVTEVLEELRKDDHDG